jgi:hypothetical protein
MTRRAKPLPHEERRLTNEKRAELDAAICEIVEEHQPMGVRAVFYKLVGRNIVEKTDYKGSKSGLCVTDRRVLALRKAGEIPWEWITDAGRSVECNVTFTSMQDATDYWLRSYRRSALKECSQDYIQIWIEKEGLASLVRDVADDYDVPVVPMGGQPSYSLVLDAAKRIKRSKKPAIIYHFGDYDPSGSSMTNSIGKQLREVAPTLKFEIVRAALTREQVDKYKLPTRPTKREGNTHAKTFSDSKSVELDAMPADLLKQMVKTAINQHILDDDVAELRQDEDRERDELKALVAQRSRK